MKTLFTSVQIGILTLPNRIVMAPMTRSRAVGNVPNGLMAQYYSLRAEAGLLITEGISPSPNGLGSARIPGIYSEAQVAGWRTVTDAVHAAGGRMFVQLMHTGCVGHPINLTPGARLLGPSAVAALGEMWTDSDGMQPHPRPDEMTEQDISTAIGEYAAACKNAVAAGFDGVELHGANGYLIDQFLNTASNRRSDRSGGSIDNRIRFAVEVARAVAAAALSGSACASLPMACSMAWHRMRTWMPVSASGRGAQRHRTHRHPCGRPQLHGRAAGER